MVYKKFILKTLGFSEWLEVQDHASKTSNKSNDLLLQSLRTKFKWDISRAKKLGIPPPPELENFEISSKDKKRKRTEILKEVFVKDDVVVMKGLSECKDIVKEVKDYLKAYLSLGMDNKFSLFDKDVGAISGPRPNWADEEDEMKVQKRKEGSKVKGPRPNWDDEEDEMKVQKRNEGSKVKGPRPNWADEEDEMKVQKRKEGSIYYLMVKSKVKGPRPNWADEEDEMKVQKRKEGM
nr:hypothetical protein [Tanacetum cinerariifolium]